MGEEVEVPLWRGGEDGTSAVLVSSSESDTSSLKMSSRATLSVVVLGSGASGSSISSLACDVDGVKSDCGVATSMSAVACGMMLSCMCYLFYCG